MSGQAIFTSSRLRRRTGARHLNPCLKRETWGTQFRGISDRCGPPAHGRAASRRGGVGLDGCEEKSCVHLNPCLKSETWAPRVVEVRPGPPAHFHFVTFKEADWSAAPEPMSQKRDMGHPASINVAEHPPELAVLLPFVVPLFLGKRARLAPEASEERCKQWKHQCQLFRHPTRCLVVAR